MEFSNKPQLFIITGSNGAGKSTYKQSLLPSKFNNLDIFDGDIFFVQKRNEFYRRYRSDKEARKLAEEALEEEFLRLVEMSIDQRTSFAYEGHFTGDGAWKIPERFKKADFEINLIFCGLNTYTRSLQRVETRVKKGGFHVRPLDIENNYWGNMEKLDQHFGMFNSVELIDTSGYILSIGKLTFGEVAEALRMEEIPRWVKKGMPVIFELLSKFL